MLGNMCSFRHLLVMTSAFALGLVHAAPVDINTTYTGISVDGTSFALDGEGVSYHFHVHPEYQELVLDHFGGSATEVVELPDKELVYYHGWIEGYGRYRKEFPDLGRGDFRIPAFQIRHSGGTTVTAFVYTGYDIIQGKPAGLAGLPSTFGAEDEVSTLVVHLFDNVSSIAADLSYSIFSKHDTIARSVNLTNYGESEITIEKLASLSVDLPFDELDMIRLRGDWGRENQRTRDKISYGIQGFQSTTGHTGHQHNPFVAIMPSSTTETQGEVWGFSLIYSGSFSVEVEKGSHGWTRTMMGLNPLQLSWPLKPGETFTSPEAIATYSDQGIGGLSRKVHRLINQHVIQSSWVTEARPPLLNSWEGLYFDYNQTTIEKLAQDAADLGLSLFVLDDGWFGDEYPRNAPDAGLGDWVVNPDKFPGGLGPLVENVNDISVANSPSGDKLRFGLWFEPEMVNPNSTLYNEHPDWVLHADGYERTYRRKQLVLNLGLPQVQEHIIDSVSSVISSANISYIKWDANRGFHETSSLADYHKYMLGLYRVLGELTSRYPDILWEGCASGGGRWDAGMLHYFPQTWTSDNQDPLDRLYIQFGTSIAYPASAVGAHIATAPDHTSGRSTPILFRGHVALMGASFGLELNPAVIPEENVAELPALIELSRVVSPIVIRGDLYRINVPEESNWPAAMYVMPEKDRAVLFAFQMRNIVNQASRPAIRLQGLDPGSRYKVDNRTLVYSGRTLMNVGLQFGFNGDMASEVVLIEKVG